MESVYRQVIAHLRDRPQRWLVTGAAGFVGSHLLDALLRNGQQVVGLDDFSTGSRSNLEAVRRAVGDAAWRQFEFREASILDPGQCLRAVESVDCILHQAGFVSVPLSIATPQACLQTNVVGTHNLFESARVSGVGRIVYASSSAVYGENPCPELTEDNLGRQLSPYAVSKRVTEMYADVFALQYGLKCAGLRYFNVFGPRQSATGGYAAVIPTWLGKMAAGVPCQIHGSGSATRDFCHVSDVVQANILAAVGDFSGSKVFNVGLGKGTSLLELHATMARLVESATGRPVPPPIHGPVRPGDIEHSRACIGKIAGELGFQATTTLERGLEEMVRWSRSVAADVF